MITINNQELAVENLTLPVLINGADKSGASFFSVEFISELFLKGNKVLFFSGFEMAKDSFSERVKNSGKHIARAEHFEEGLENSDCIILPDADEVVLVDFIDRLADIQDRILYIKNFDMYSSDTLIKLAGFNKLVCMGDMDKAQPEAKKIQFSTKIYFTYPEDLARHNLPELPKYSGYLENSTRNGLLRIAIINI